MKRQKLSERTLPNYTKGEEIFNMVTHIVGGAVGVAAVVLCVIFAALHRNIYGVVSGAIYGASMINLYSMSSIYHGLKPRLFAKRVFQVIDHCSIFLLIAGTYTPITLSSLRADNPVLGWVLFGVIWAVAALGITFNSIDIKKYKVFSAICYLVMGWCIVFAWKPTVAALGMGGISLLLWGGISYTVGALFYYFFKKMKYMHSVFHIFVVIGSVLHLLCILLYAM